MPLLLKPNEHRNQEDRIGRYCCGGHRKKMRAGGEHHATLEVWARVPERPDL